MQGKRFAVLGDPVEHSLSPPMHNAALASAGIPGTYEAIRVPGAELAFTIQRVRQSGYCGFNVTIPHKEAVLPLLDRVSHAAMTVGAVNTVVCTDRGLRGCNTDIIGFKAALRSFDQPFGRANAVIFGAGGAARAVLYALLTKGAEVTVVSRDVEKARVLVQRLRGGEAVAAGDVQAVCRIVQDADLIVNATPLGMSHLSDRSPLPSAIRLRAKTAVVDLVYGRDTPFLREATRSGCQAQDGLEMLVQQGRAAFRLWTGASPDAGVMRQACLQALKGGA